MHGISLIPNVDLGMRIIMLDRLYQTTNELTDRHWHQRVITVPRLDRGIDPGICRGTVPRLVAGHDVAATVPKSRSFGRPVLVSYR